MEHPTHPDGRDGKPSGREIPRNEKIRRFCQMPAGNVRIFCCLVFPGYSRVICWKKARARSRSWALGWPLARPPTSLKGPKVS